MSSLFSSPYLIHYFRNSLKRGTMVCFVWVGGMGIDIGASYSQSHNRGAIITDGERERLNA